MRIVNLAENPSLVEPTAGVLIDAFRENWPDAWSDLPSAIGEVRESLDAGRLSRVAVDDASEVLGFIGGSVLYEGNVVELHPLAVRVDCQGRGIGRALVLDLENCARRMGATTVLVGTDDESGLTSLGGVDLYPDPLDHLRSLRNLRRHPFEFYRKLGYAVVGVFPDANGFGKPDIWMAKRVGTRERLLRS